jgi:hypothetical protein
MRLSLSISASRVTSLDRLVDEILDCYLAWRNAASNATAGYRAWCASGAADRSLRFGAYLASLDQEECTATAYAQIVADVVRRVDRQP